MNTSESYRKLIVWQKSLDLAEGIYRLTGKFPKEEIYGLSIQMRRAAVSIPSNIAEGSKRKDLPEYIQFLRVASGSAAELEAQIAVCKRIYPFEDRAKAESLLEEVQKMLSALISRLRDKHHSKLPEND